jgi:hypothetical protein
LFGGVDDLAVDATSFRDIANLDKERRADAVDRSDLCKVDLDVPYVLSRTLAQRTPQRCGFAPANVSGDFDPMIAVAANFDCAH